jgi:hypothetical protein
MRRLLVRLLAGILLSSLLGGCARTPARSDVREYLEEATGTTITFVSTPAAFVREQPGLASSGRDYVYLAPIAVSRGGERSCWLWLGIWSTVDRQARNEGAAPLRLGTLQILVDNEPMDMDPQSVDSHPAGIRQIPYATPVPPTQELLAPITCSQLQRLGRARALTLSDQPAGDAARLWRGDDHAAAMLSHFADPTGAARTDRGPVSGR